MGDTQGIYIVIMVGVWQARGHFVPGETTYGECSNDCSGDAALRKSRSTRRAAYIAWFDGASLVFLLTRNTSGRATELGDLGGMLVLILLDILMGKHCKYK